MLKNLNKARNYRFLGQMNLLFILTFTCINIFLMVTKGEPDETLHLAIFFVFMVDSFLHRISVNNYEDYIKIKEQGTEQ